MSLKDFIARLFGFGWRQRRSYHFEEPLAQSLRLLAERERRSEEEVAADLINFALAQRDASEANLRRWRELSGREQQIAALACLGYTNRQIAAHLKISPETVKTHVRNVLYKFDLRSKAELRQMLANWDFSAWLS